VSNVIIGGTATGATPLPVAGTIDGTADYIPIYTANATATQAINRNTYLGLSNPPLGTLDSQTVGSKTLNNTNTITLKDTLFTLQDDGDTTKQLKFQLSGITTATTRTLTIPDASDTIVGLAAAQTLTNKTLTSPTITSPTITNATISADTVTGYSVSNTGTIYGISVTTGTIGSAALAANSVTNTAIAANALLTSKVSIPYKFSVYRNSAQNSGNGSDAIVTFDTKIFDTGTNYSTGTGLFTAPIAGWYWFSWNVHTTAATLYWLSFLYKNGASFVVAPALSLGGGTSIAQYGSSSSIIMQLAANDTIGIYSRSNGGSAIQVGAAPIYTYFSGWLISLT
jgi:C1q domain